MTLRKTFSMLRDQLKGMKPEDPVAEIVINIVDASVSYEGNRNTALILGQMTITVNKPGGMVTEMFEENDPRRVIVNRDKL